MVAVIRRTQSDLRLNPHVHAVFVDGGFSPTGETRPSTRSTLPRTPQHAATCAGAEDDGGRERLLRYVLRPAVAQERIQKTEQGFTMNLPLYSPTAGMCVGADYAGARPAVGGRAKDCVGGFHGVFDSAVAFAAAATDPLLHVGGLAVVLYA